MQEIYYDRNKRCSETKTLKTYDDFDAGDPAAVQQLFADAAELAPARNYGLIIGCHGKAWIPASGGVLPARYSRPTTVDDGARSKQTRSFGDTGYELDITELAAALEAQRFPFRLPDLRRLFHGQYRDAVRPAPCGGLYRGLSLRDHGRRFPLRPDRPPPVRRKRRVRRSRKKPAGSSGTSTRTTGTPSRETNSRGASRWPSRRNWMHWRRRCARSKIRNSRSTSTRFNTQRERHEAVLRPGALRYACCNDQGAIDGFKAQMELAFPVSCRHHTKYFYSAYDAIKHPVNYYSGVSVSEPSTVYAAENRQTNWYRDTH